MQWRISISVDCILVGTFPQKQREYLETPDERTRIFVRARIQQCANNVGTP
jgi:uncharacterized protein YjlB